MLNQFTTLKFFFFFYKMAVVYCFSNLCKKYTDIHFYVIKLCLAKDIILSDYGSTRRDEILIILKDFLLSLNLGSLT